MQVILKQIKKSKLSLWFMPCFSKMAQLIGLLSLVGIHPWLLLVLQCLTLSDILTTSQKRVQGCFLARDIFYEDMFSYIQDSVNGKFLHNSIHHKHQYFKSVDRKAKPEVLTHESFFSATFYTRRLCASPKVAASEKILRSDVDCFCW